MSADGSIVTPAQALETARRVLSVAAAGDPARALSAAEAQALRAQIHDRTLEARNMRDRADAADKRVHAMHLEHDKLVGQIVSEETRAMRAEAELRRLTEGAAADLVEARKILAHLVEAKNTKRWREVARRFLGEA